MEEDLGIKIGNKEESFWTEIMTLSKKAIETLERELKINKSIVEMCELKIQNEKTYLESLDINPLDIKTFGED